MAQTTQAEATGDIADLFAAGVGFSASWGAISRSLTRIRGEFLTPGGNVDWTEAAPVVQTALSETVAPAPDSDADLPEGVQFFDPKLYGHVAVSQHFSGWGRPGRSNEGFQRLVLVRCHIGKRRIAGRKENLILLQYRAWRRRGTEAPEYAASATEAWPLVGDVHAEVQRQLATDRALGKTEKRGRI